MRAAFVLIPLLAAAVAADVIDHSCADLSAVPTAWIEAVKALDSHYAHTSHGSQLTWGATFIEQSNPLYDISVGVGYLPTTPGAWCVFDGQIGQSYVTPDLYWETPGGMNMTRAVLNANPSIDTSMWCWCTQCDSYSQAQVQAYLTAMAQLESEYPDVTFVYFTGNAQGTGSAGYNRWLRNDQIRDFCVAGDRMLFDFEDLDSWWYNPATSQWEHHTYTWQGNQVPSEHPHYYGDQYGHTTAESCTQKGEAWWWMMAVIAGWGGMGTGGGSAETAVLGLALPNPSAGSIEAGVTMQSPGEVSLSVYDMAGREVCSFSGQLGEGASTVVLEPGCTGAFLVTAECGGQRACGRTVVLR
jgi:hypothetical protein